MALIRQAQLAESMHSAIVLDLGDLRRQAEALKAAARAEADRIVELGRGELERLKGEASEAGRAEGLARGLEEGRRAGEEAAREAVLGEFRPRLEALEKAWTAALDEFLAHRETMVRDAGEGVVALAARVAEMVTRRAVKLDGGAAGAQVGAALGLVTGPAKLVIRVNPGDRRMFREALGGLSARFDGARGAEIAEDASLPAGSCVVSTPGGGEIDASIDTQVERIVEALLPSKTRRSRKP